MPASPMAWISTCQPRRSASATKASRSSRAPLRPPGRGVADVRIEHGGRPGLDDAVGEGLEDAGVEPLPATQVADEVFVTVQGGAPVLERHAGAHRQGQPGPDPERALIPERPPQGNVLGFCPGLLDRRDPGRVQAGDRSSHRVERGRGRRARDMPGDEVLGAFLERSGRLAGHGVADDDAVGRVGCLAVDPGQTKGRRVRPARVAVEAAHERRAVRNDRVELGTVGHAAGERHVQPALAEHPGRRGVGRGVRRDRGLDVGEGIEPEQVDAVELVGALAHVDMGVVEAGRDQPATRLDDLGARSTPVAQAVVAAPDPGDPPAPHRDRVRGLGRRVLRRAGDEDAAADDQQVGGVAHRARLVSSAALTAGHSGAITLK